MLTADGFALGALVTLRWHGQPYRVLGLKGEPDGQCVPAVLIGAVDNDACCGWVQPSDLARVNQGV